MLVLQTVMWWGKKRKESQTLGRLFDFFLLFVKRTFHRKAVSSTALWSTDAWSNGRLVDYFSLNGILLLILFDAPIMHNPGPMRLIELSGEALLLRLPVSDGRMKLHSKSNYYDKLFTKRSLDFFLIGSNTFCCNIWNWHILLEPNRLSFHSTLLDNI